MVSKGRKSDSVSSHASGGNYLLSTDGSGTGPLSDPAPGAIGVVLRNPRGATIGTISQAIGPATNTEAEYRALVEGLRMSLEKGVRRIRVFVDSELLVDQLDGKAVVRAEHLRKIHEEAATLLERFADHRLSWVPRAWNREADALATAALASPPMSLQASDRSEDSHQSDETATQVIDAEGQAAWISEQTDLPLSVVMETLELEFEFMVATGIVSSPGYEFRHYSPDELLDTGAIVDTQRLAEDAERLLNIPREIAASIFDAEYQFLRMRGLAE